MNTRTLILLSVISLIGVLWFAFLRGGNDETVPVDPLSLIDFETGVHSIACYSEEQGTEWTITTSGDEVHLSSDSIAKGQAVRANRPLLRRIFSFLRDEVPLSHHQVESIDLKEWGLQPPTLKVTITEANRTTELHVGRPDINDEVGYRVAGGNVVFRVKEHLIATLRQSPQHYRDPRLLDVGLSHIQKVAYLSANADPFSVRRLGARWMVRAAEVDRRGDQQLCDAWTNAMSGLKGAPVDSMPELDPDIEIRGTVSFQIENETAESKVEVLGVTMSGQVVARRENDSDLRVLEPHFTRYFRHRPDDLADRILIGFAEDELSRVRLTNTDGSGSLELINPKGSRWFVMGPSSKKHRVDSSAIQGFLEQLLSMPTEGNRGATSHFEAARTVRFEFDRQDGAPPMLVAFGGPDGDGNRWARRSDEDGEARVSQEACKGLRTQWWQLLDKAVALGDDSRIDWLRITDQDGKIFEVMRSDGVFRIDGNSVNIEFLKKTLARCAYLVASGFTGPVSDEAQEALALPTWKVEWRHEGAARGALRPDGVEVYEWRIGRRINATDYECTISNLPGTVFLIAGRDFNMLRGTADGIDRARAAKK